MWPTRIKDEEEIVDRGVFELRLVWEVVGLVCRVMCLLRHVAFLVCQVALPGLPSGELGVQSGAPSGVPCPSGVRSGVEFVPLAATPPN